ncbi:hypothetical protein OC835_003500 [Tilletia horrida]|nr:hypothetical protein OC835_003500 [Tilletia horrida]KAK0566703.1 hypothetical protein OC844_000609 [Tilletia horrida]
MDTPLAPPLRLIVAEPAQTISYDAAAASIRTFLEQYSARTGSADGGAQASSTSAQLSRLAENLDRERR